MGVPRLLQADLASAMRDHGEEVIHHPPGAADRTYLAVIQRGEPRRSFRSDSGAQAHAVTVVVRASADATIGSEAFADVGHAMTLPLRYGETPTRCRVIAVQSSNPGFFRIRVAR